jgi:hypothetical protein
VASCRNWTQSWLNGWPVTASMTLRSPCWRSPHHAERVPPIGDHIIAEPAPLPGSACQ